MMYALAKSAPGAGVVEALALAMPDTLNRKWHAAAAQVQHKRADAILRTAISHNLRRILPDPKQTKLLRCLSGGNT